MDKNVNGSVLFSIKDLRKSFGDHEVLCGVDIDIKDGEKIAVISWGKPLIAKIAYIIIKS